MAEQQAGHKQQDRAGKMQQKVQAKIADFTDDKVQQMYNRFQAKQKGSKNQCTATAKDENAHRK